MRKRHERDLQQIEEAHLEELNCFNIEWDGIIQKFNEEIRMIEAELTEKHEQQLVIIG